MEHRVAMERWFEARATARGWFLLTLGLALALGASVSRQTARADDWLLQRRDGRRTAASTARLDMRLPATRFRTYLGGRLSGAAMLGHDVDHDGRDEVVFLVGGRVLAKEADTDLIDWESPILSGASQLYGPVDFDEDGAPELLVFRAGIPADVWLISLADGHVLWHLPGHVIYQFRWPRVGDLDGDGHLDLYLGTGRCGNVPPGWGDPPPGVAYTFCDGAGCDLSAGRELWRLSTGVAQNCGDGARIVDLDGDGTPELVASSGYTEIGIYDGATGALDGQLASPERLFNRSNTAIALADVVGDAAPEVFAVTRAAVSGVGSQSLAVYGHDATGYHRLWQFVAPDSLADRLIFDDLASVADLDGDGTKEVVFGLVDGSTSIPTIFVRTASDGAERTSLAGYTLAGLADFDGDGRPEIYAQTAGGVVALAFDGSGLTPRFTLPDVVPVSTLDLEASLSRRPVGGIALRDLDDDPELELLAGVTNADGALVGLRAFDVVADTPTVIGSFDAPANVDVVGVAFAGPVTTDTPQLLVSTSDGFVLVLDDTLTVTNRYEGLEFSLPGMRAGGYLLGTGGPAGTALAVSPGTDPSAHGLYVVDSRGIFSRFDVRSADAATPPIRVYSLPRVERPALADLDGDGALELTAVERGSALVVRDAADSTERWAVGDATTRWGRSPTWLGLLMGGPLPVAAGADRRVLLETVETDATGDFLRVHAYAGSDGSLLATSDRFRLLWGGNNYGIAATADVDGDGFDDYVSSPTTPIRLSGTTLATTGTASGAGVQRSDPLLADLDGDGDLDVFAHGSWSPSRAVDATTLAALAAGESRVNVGRYGALVQCSGVASVVSGTALPGELYVERLAAGAITTAAHRVLAGGMSYDLASLPAEAEPGSLSNVTSVAGLEASDGPAVLVGSSDGFLYALDACDLTLRWALELRFPVGEPIVADADGDGVDEVYVSAADGFFYGLRGAAYPPPEPVIDLDPSSSAITDVDEVDSAASLKARWAAVAGATSYEVGVLTSGGTALTSPAFRDVGDVTEVTVADLPLRLGGRYVVAVRALGPAGASGEASSDGVVIADLLGPDLDLRAGSPLLVGGTPVDVRLGARDNWSLGGYELTVVDAADAPVRSLESGAFSGASGSVTTAWDGAADDGTMVPEGEYRVVARVMDGAGHESVIDAIIEVTRQPVDTMDAGGAPDGGVDGGVEGSGGGGCGCVVTGGARSHSPWALFTIALVAGLVRRRRSR